MQGPTLLVFTQCTLAKYLSFYWTASVDFKNSYDEWCIVIQKAQDKARCLLKEYDQKFLPLKVLNSTLICNTLKLLVIKGNIMVSNNYANVDGKKTKN